MTLTQKSAPYAHWDFVHPSSGDRLRIIPERGGLVSGWCCGGREILYFDQDRYADPSKSIRGGIPVLFPICGNLPGDVLPVDGVDHPPSSSTASLGIFPGSFSCSRIRAVCASASPAPTKR